MFLFDKPIAHRGLHDSVRTENSMAAFHNAIDSGYNIETDVHLLKSGEVVVFHDYNLKRVCGIDKEIQEMTLDDVKGDKYLLPNGEHIPLFSEMLDTVNGRTGILLELKYANMKDHRLEEAVYELIKGKENWIAVQSFSPIIVGWFTQHAPEFYRGLLSNLALHPMIWFFHRHIKPDFISYGVENSKWVHSFCNRMHYKLLVWTVRTDENIMTAKAIRADNIIFEKIIPENHGFSLKPLSAPAQQEEVL